MRAMVKIDLILVLAIILGVFLVGYSASITAEEAISQTWSVYTVGGLTLVIGTKEQNKALFTELGNPTIYGLHPRGSKTYVATSDPGVIVHEFAHSFNKSWAGHNHVPYTVREVTEAEVRKIINLSNLKLEAPQQGGT